MTRAARATTAAATATSYSLEAVADALHSEDSARILAAAKALGYSGRTKAGAKAFVTAALEASPAAATGGLLTALLSDAAARAAVVSGLRRRGLWSLSLLVELMDSPAADEEEEEEEEETEEEDLDSTEEEEDAEDAVKALFKNSLADGGGKGSVLYDLKTLLKIRGVLYGPRASDTKKRHTVKPGASEALDAYLESVENFDALYETLTEAEFVLGSIEDTEEEEEVEEIEEEEEEETEEEEEDETDYCASTVKLLQELFETHEVQDDKEEREGAELIQRLKATGNAAFMKLVVFDNKRSANFCGIKKSIANATSAALTKKIKNGSFDTREIWEAFSADVEEEAAPAPAKKTKKPKKAPAKKTPAKKEAPTAAPKKRTRKAKAPKNPLNYTVDTDTDEDGEEVNYYLVQKVDAKAAGLSKSKMKDAGFGFEDGEYYTDEAIWEKAKVRMTEEHEITMVLSK